MSTKKQTAPTNERLPALRTAQKIQDAAANLGFEWPQTSCVLDKLEEEIQEMREAIAKNDKENQREELGDILFLLANYARMLEIDSEDALHEAGEKFQRRFNGLKADLEEKGFSLPGCPLKEMTEAWIRQKKRERQSKNR